MLRLLRSLLVVVAITITLQPLANSQSPTSSKAQAPPSSGLTLKTNAHLVIVDVVVTDKNQNSVRDLKQSDFSLAEESTPQTIRSFEEHHPVDKVSTLPPIPKLPPGVFTNYVPVPPTDSLNIILLDNLNTEIVDQLYALHQLQEYLKIARPGTRTAIFGLTTRLILLQGFTSDPEILKTAISRRLSAASPIPETPADTEQVSSLARMGVGPNGDGLTLAEVTENLKQLSDNQQTDQFVLRTRYTLDAMNVLARYLSGMPGRKNLIWFSGSFPINLLPNESRSEPFESSAWAADEFRETTSLLTLSQVAVYPVDPRGIVGFPEFQGLPGPTAPGQKPLISTVSSTSGSPSSLSQRIAAEHSTAVQMAQDTGGHAFVNTNDLSHAIADAIQNGSSYYTLTYAPTNSTWDGDFRKIQVKLKQQGYNLAYRHGYYAIDSTAPTSTKAKKTVASPQGAPPPPDPMRTAMIRGGPNSAQIIFKARVLPAAAALEETPASGNKPNPDAKFSHGPYRRYTIDIAADPHSIYFTKSADGKYHSHIEVRAYVFDQDGQLIVETSTSNRADISADALNSIIKNGYPLHQQISVPIKGNFYIRIGVYDFTGDHIGSIEVPVAAVKDLTPLPASISSPTDITGAPN